MQKYTEDMNTKKEVDYDCEDYLLSIENDGDRCAKVGDILFKLSKISFIL